MQFKRFFSVDSPKAIKAAGFGYLNAINYMAPANTAGVGNLCPHASPGCLALCLGWYSGQAGMLSNATLETGTNAVRRSRQRKAQMFMRDRAEFMGEMSRHIEALRRRAQTLGLALCVRLNGATDISWEGIRPGGVLSVFSAFPDVQFVDYTKSKRRALAHASHMLPANYHLTFSRSETNEADCLEVLNAGGNVAVVFEARPDTWRGFRVIGGDQHDLRHLDPDGRAAGRGFVIGLSPKGRKARSDESGFVVRASA
jgi:hypothetical protein